MATKVLEFKYGSVIVENEYGLRMKMVGEENDHSYISLSADEAEKLARVLLAFVEIEKP